MCVCVFFFNNYVLLFLARSVMETFVVDNSMPASFLVVRNRINNERYKHDMLLKQRKKEMHIWNNFVFTHFKPSLILLRNQANLFTAKIVEKHLWKSVILNYVAVQHATPLKLILLHWYFLQLLPVKNHYADLVDYWAKIAYTTLILKNCILTNWSFLNPGLRDLIIFNISVLYTFALKSHKPS